LRRFLFPLSVNHDLVLPSSISPRVSDTLVWSCSSLFFGRAVPIPLSFLVVVEVFTESRHRPSDTDDSECFSSLGLSVFFPRPLHAIYSFFFSDAFVSAPLAFIESFSPLRVNAGCSPRKAHARVPGPSVRSFLWTSSSYILHL